LFSRGFALIDNLDSLEKLDSPDTQRWLKKQSSLTATYFGQVPQRPKILSRLKQLMDYPKIGVPWQRRGYVYCYANMGLQSQSVVMRRALAASDFSTILDPTDFSADGRVAIAGLRLSEDCRYLAYGLSRSGSDWQEWSIRDLDRLVDLNDCLQGIRGGVIAWLPDHSGFFYTRTYEQHPGHQTSQHPSQAVMLHRLNTSQESDEMIFACPPAAPWTLIPRVTDDGEQLLIFAYESANDQNRIWFKRIEDLHQDAHPIVDDFSSYYVLFRSINGRLWLRTDYQAPRGQILEIDISAYPAVRRKVIVAEEAGIIERASVVDQTLIVTYLEHAYSNVKLFELDGRLRCKANVPEFGNLSGFEGLPHHEVCYYSFSSFNSPQTIYEFNVRQNTSKLFWENRLAFDPDGFVTRQVFVDSAPGIRVPMFISHRRDLDLSRTNPCYLYSYGGFGFCHKPFFSTAHLHWMELGGIFCLANVRGGGEYGQLWHDGGRLHHKPNTFSDFTACARWLIEQKLTDPTRLAAGGRSNGGLTVAASVLKSPDVFAAAIVAVGVLDLLRFDQLTVGWTWKAEYGDPNNPSDRQLLRSYSPVHNIAPSTRYPAFLVSTADHDDRVHPSHSLKFARCLQLANHQPTTKLLRVEAQAGHGAGKPLQGYLDEVADFLAFLVRELRMDHGD
jgi:prolyl oligopeptidase